MGRYTVDDQKGYTFAVTQGDATAPLTEVEKELYSYIEKLEGAIERLEERVSIAENGKQPQT